MNNDERVLELAKELIRVAEAFNYDTAVERIEDQFRALVAAPQPSALKDKQIAAGQECSPLMDAQTPWVGCGECDVLFPCNNGGERCIRLPRQMRELDKALRNDADAPQPSALKGKQIAAGQTSEGTSAGHTRPVASESTSAATTPTPRTDAMVRDHRPFANSPTAEIDFDHLSFFARQLERELSAAHADSELFRQLLAEANMKIAAERKNVNDLNSALRNAGWGQGEIDSASETIYGMEAQIAALRDELARHQESKFHPD